MRIGVLKPVYGVSILDILVIVTLVWMVVCFMECNYSNDRPLWWGILYNDCISNAVLTVMVYFIARLSFSIHFRLSETVFYVLMFSLMLFELWICTQQYVFFKGEMVGSLGNSGLLGGFLSICICTIGATIIKTRKKLFLFLLLPVLFVVLKTLSRASWLSIVIVIFLLCVERKPIRTFLYSWKVPLILIVLATVFYVYFLKRESAESRLFMAMVVLRYMPETGLFGAGPGNYCGFYGKALYDYFLSERCGFFDSSIECMEILTQLKTSVGIPDYSYNEPLRLLTETGLIGASLLTVVTIVSFTRLYKMREPLSYGYLALIIFSQFSFPSVVPLFCCMFAVFMAAGASVKSENTMDGINLHLIICTILSIAIMCIGVKEKDKDYANREFMKMHDSYELAFYKDACITGEWLYSKGYASALFMLEYGTSLCEVRDYEKCKRVLSHGMEMSASPMFWKVFGDNSFNTGDYSMAEMQYLHSFIMAPNRMQPLLDLARLYSVTGQTDKLSLIKDYSKRIIPKVENEKTREIRKKISDFQSEVR